jgi:trehalose 6-phosphate phosphatase
MRPELEPLRRRPRESGVFLDFDGTLSEIVPVASDARPVPGARDVLARLAARVAVVAVISGRSAEELLDWLGPAVEIWGVHGAQRAVDGNVVLADALRPFAASMANVRDEVADELERAGVEGAVVEDKVVVVTLHYRAASDPQRAERAVTEIATAAARRHGLEIVAGRMAVELRPPVELSKASVVRERVRGADLAAAMFVGDDTVDLPAFDALDELSSEGVAGVRVGVRSAESPAELLARADVVVDGPPGVLELLGELAAP